MSVDKCDQLAVLGIQSPRERDLPCGQIFDQISAYCCDDTMSIEYIGINHPFLCLEARCRHCHKVKTGMFDLRKIASWLAGGTETSFRPSRPKSPDR